MNSAEQQHDDTPTDYVSVGFFDPLVAKRIMKHLSREGLRFLGRDAGGVGMAGAEVRYTVPSGLPRPILQRLNRIELLVHTADAEKAYRVIDVA
jgi:hypothetical protein